MKRDLESLTEPSFLSLRPFCVTAGRNLKLNQLEALIVISLREVAAVP